MGTIILDEFGYDKVSHTYGTKQQIMDNLDKINPHEIVLSTDTDELYYKDNMNVVRNVKDYSKAMVEDTIESLKNGAKYRIGDVVEVLGYYAKGDGSNHKRVASNIDDGTGVLGQNNLWWNIVHNGEVNVSWFGIKPNANIDVQEEINKIFLLNPKAVKFDKGVYLIQNKTNDTSGLKPLDGVEIIGIGKDTVIKLIPNDYDHCKGFNIWGKKNIKIHDMSIIGDRNEHAYNQTTNEWGHGISLEGSTGNKTGTPCDNIEIYNVWCDDWIGDGICVWNCDNINIHDVYCNNNRRQGISHVGGKNFKYNNLFLTNTNGTSPEYGLDIEVETENNNGYIGTVYTKGNRGGGVLVANGGLGQQLPTEGWNFHIDNIISENDGNSFSFYGNKNSNEINTIVNNIISKNCDRVVNCVDVFFKNSLYIGNVLILTTKGNYDKVAYTKTDNSRINFVNIGNLTNLDAGYAGYNVVNANGCVFNLKISGNVLKNSLIGSCDFLEINTPRVELTGNPFLATDVYVQKYFIKQEGTTTLYNVKNLALNSFMDFEIKEGSTLNLVSDIGDGSSNVRYLVDGVITSSGVLTCRSSCRVEKIEDNLISVVFRQVKKDITV